MLGWLGGLAKRFDSLGKVVLLEETTATQATDQTRVRYCGA